MTCPVCRARTEALPRGAAGDYRLYDCPKCGVGFCDPMKGPGAEWYEGSELYFMGHHTAPRLFWQHRRFLERRPKGRRLLDVGCGEGTFLAAARDAGYDVWGLDFDRKNIANAKTRHGLKRIFPLSIEAFCRKSRERFDLVTFYEVLEHLEDPRRFLRQVKGLLKAGGRIAFSCPNRDRSLDAMRSGDLPPNHLTRWKAGTLGAFVEAAGYRVETLEVKPFAADEVEEYLRGRVKFGLARSLVRQSAVTGREDAMVQAKRLMGVKDRALRIVAAPVAFLAKPFPLQGSNLYCEARLQGKR